MNTLTLAEFDKLKDIADIRLALFADDTYTELTESTSDERGQLRQVTVTRNLLTNTVITKQEIAWDYHDNGDVKDIVTRDLDATDKELAKKTLSHFTDDRQPILTVQKEADNAILGSS